MLPIQNGLGSADVVAEVLGDEAVLIGVAEGFGASLVGPGHAHHHGMALVRLGERRGPRTERVERLAELWRAAGSRSRPTTTSIDSSGRSSCATSRSAAPARSST